MGIFWLNKILTFHLIHSVLARVYQTWKQDYCNTKLPYSVMTHLCSRPTAVPLILPNSTISPSVGPVEKGLLFRPYVSVSVVWLFPLEHGKVCMFADWWVESLLVFHYLFVSASFCQIGSWQFEDLQNFCGVFCCLAALFQDESSELRRKFWFLLPFDLLSIKHFIFILFSVVLRASSYTKYKLKAATRRIIDRCVHI